MKWPEGTEDVARGVQDLLAAVEREDPALVPNLATYRLRRAEYSRVRSADKPGLQFSQPIVAPAAIEYRL